MTRKKHGSLGSFIAASCCLIAIALSISSPALARSIEVNGVWYILAGTDRAFVTNRNFADEAEGPYTGDVVVPEQITYRGRTYSVISVASNAFACCEGLTSVSLPSTLRSINTCAFIGCTNLKQVTMPTTRLTVSSCAFTGCTSLQKITLPRLTERLDSLTFYCCASLRTLVLPHRLSTVCQGALEHLPLLTNLYCFASEPPKAEQGAFSMADQQNCTLHVPRETLQQYKASPIWNKFYRIVALSDNDYLAQGYQRGDVNDDGQVDADDLDLLRRILVSLPDDSAVRWAADINGDGTINAVDYVMFAGQLKQQ